MEKGSYQNPIQLLAIRSCVTPSLQFHSFTCQKFPFRNFETEFDGRALGGRCEAMALSSILDSEATFVQQAQEVGLGEPWIDALRTSSLATFAKLSFAITSPGTVASDEQINRFLNTLRGGVAATIAETSAFKRLLFESQTLMMHRFKSVARGDEVTPKRMAPPEREARLARQKQQLRGLDISGPTEPSYGLYDLCTSMIEKNEISYISPSKCLSRQQELVGSKPEKEIQLDASKTALVIKEQPSVAEINISSDLALYQALVRRTLAMDLTGLATFEVMKRWVDRMFEIYSQSPAPGFSKVSQAQLLRADRQSFIRLSEMFTGSLKATTTAGYPLDPHIEKLYTDVSVTYYMLPIPTSSQSSSSSDKTDKKRPEAAPKAAAPANKFLKSGTKGKGKGKKREPVPQALKGMHSRTPQGDAICFGYNLGTCKHGSSCQRKHVCAVPGCYKNHPQTEHQ